MADDKQMDLQNSVADDKQIQVMNKILKQFYNWFLFTKYAYSNYKLCVDNGRWQADGSTELCSRWQADTGN